MKAEHASLTEAFVTTKTRETVALAREFLGGNGVLIDYDVGRFFADEERNKMSYSRQ